MAINTYAPPTDKTFNGRVVDPRERRITFNRRQDRFFWQHVIRHGLTQVDCTTMFFGDVIAHLGLEAMSPGPRGRVEDSVKSALKRRAREITQRVGIPRIVDAEDGLAVAKYPEWTEAWTREDWDGAVDWTPLYAANVARATASTDSVDWVEDGEALGDLSLHSDDRGIAVSDRSKTPGVETEELDTEDGVAQSQESVAGDEATDSTYVKLHLEGAESQPATISCASEASASRRHVRDDPCDSCVSSSTASPTPSRLFSSQQAPSHDTLPQTWTSQGSVAQSSTGSQSFLRIIDKEVLACLERLLSQCRTSFDEHREEDEERRRTREQEPVELREKMRKLQSAKEMAMVVQARFPWSVMQRKSHELRGCLTTDIFVGAFNDP